MNKKTNDLKKKSSSENLFLKIIDDRFDMMLRKQVENPNLILPKNFDSFIHGELFLSFLSAIYDYCTELNKVEQKQKQLEAEARGRINAPPQLLASESSKINQKLKMVSEIYCIIILKMGSFNVMYRDQNFFETMIYFIQQVLKEMFDREEFKTIEEELNRIFRTNTFNLIKRRHFEDEKLKKYPVLRENGGKESIEGIIGKMEKRARIPKTNWKFQLMNEKSEIKPYFLKQTPCASVHSRSPMIAMLLPSAKERLFQQEKERKTREASFAFRSKLNEKDLNIWMINQQSQSNDKKNKSMLSYLSKSQSKQASQSFTN